MPGLYGKVWFRQLWCYGAFLFLTRTCDGFVIGGGACIRPEGRLMGSSGLDPLGECLEQRPDFDHSEPRTLDG